MFGTVEINYTFHRYPSEQTFEGWRDQTPEGFLITLKANQQITHWRRLGNADEPISRFFEAARPLGSRLGVTLFQCPPNLPFDRSLIESFIECLPPEHRYAFEFRHPTWAEARPLLAERGAAWCVADTDDRPAPEEPLSTGTFVYLRLRRDRYADHELAAWAERIRLALGAGADVFCYFKHEEKESGPLFAQDLQQLVESGSAR
jgi:uncharacterized protein YecE (DUF72 family)